MKQFTEQELFPFRPKPFFYITTSDETELTEEKVRQSLQELKQNGYGGFIFFNKPATGFNKETYLSEAWFAAAGTFAKVAKELGLIMWINDGFDFPPGSVAGKVRKLDGTLHQQYLKKENGKVFPVKTEEGYPAFEIPRSQELFQQLVYEEYEKHIGQYFGDPIKGFFSDADNRRIESNVMFDPSMDGYEYFPWSDDFSRSFKEIYGYDITPYLSDILDWKDLPQAADYWEHAGRLYQSWAEGNYRWVKSRGLEYTGHSGDTSPLNAIEAPRSSCFTEGRFSDVQSHSDYPGTDHELYAIDCGKHMRASVYYCPRVLYGSRLIEPKMTGTGDISEDLRPKQAGSSAYLHHKKGAMCEMFAASNFGVEPEMLRRIAAFQIMQGINFVVMQAYHYRFCGETKYFAPPNFSQQGLVHHAMNEINDFIARSCALMSRGETMAPVALLDPTEAVWRNKFDQHPYFRAFNALNHQPSGFVICDTKKILDGSVQFKAAVLAGFELTEEEKKGLAQKGVKLLSYDQLDQLPSITGCDVQYEGEGTPIFAQRWIDGEAVTVISSVETDKPISGVLSGFGRSKDVTIYPGEIHWFSATGDDFAEKPAKGTVVGKLPTRAKVTFAEENLLPLEVFSDGADTVAKTSGAERLETGFETAGAMEGVKLFLPAVCMTEKTEVLLDGSPLSGRETRVFDDPYRVFALPALDAGKHTLALGHMGKIEGHDRLLLQGDFDVKIETSGYPYKEAWSYFNARVFIPCVFRPTLTQRRHELLLDDSWAMQGQPFYSGQTTYEVPIDLPETGSYRLTLPRVRDLVWCSVDGAQEQSRFMPPYTFTFAAEKGSHTVSLRVMNSMANAMECALEDSGILSGGTLERV